MRNESNQLPDSSDETRQLVARFKEMEENRKSVYFDSEELISIAEFYAYNNQPEESSKVLEYALKIHPENLDIQLYRCRALMAEGKTEDAERFLDLITDQNDREVIFLRAEILLEQSDLKNAEKLLKRLADDEGHSKEVILDIADTYIDFNMPKEAYGWLSPLYETNPDDDEIRDVMMQCTFDLKEYDKTIRIINARLDEDPYNVENWLNLGRCYLETGQEEKMFEALDFALSIDPEREDVLQVTGLCYMEEKNYEKGIEMFSKLLRINPENIGALSGMSTCLTNLGMFERAITYQTEAIDRLLPKMPDQEKAFFYQQRAFSHIMTEQLEKCKEDLDKALEYDTRNSSTYLTAANYYLIKGDIDRTLEEAGYAELYAQNDEEQLKEILMVYFQHTFFKDTIRVGKALEELLGDKARKYSYVMAYSYYAINSHSDEMIKYMVRTIVYNPKLLTLTEKSPFVDAARRVNEMLEEGIIKKEDYL